MGSDLVVGISKKSLVGLPSRSPVVRVVQVPTRGPQTLNWESLARSGMSVVYFPCSRYDAAKKKRSALSVMQYLMLKKEFELFFEIYLCTNPEANTDLYIHFELPNLRVGGRPMVDSLICESPLSKISKNASWRPAQSRILPHFVRVSF